MSKQACYKRAIMQLSNWAIKLLVKLNDNKYNTKF